MTVAARPARKLPQAANPAGGAGAGEEGGLPVRAGAYPYDSTERVSGWHTHDHHQVEYAWKGVVEVETAAAHYFLPPQQAIWIPAGLAHNTTLRSVRTVSVFFAPDMVRDGGGRARVLAVAPVVREMIVYAGRWPITRPSSGRAADAFFEALAHIVAEGLREEVPLRLPASSDPLVAEVMAYTRAHLDTVTAGGLCRSVGLSERTLRRRFQEAAGMTWRSYLLQCRLLRSMALLADPGPSVTEVAATVGFRSVSAFARAFARASGETPARYRRRIQGADPPGV